MGPARFRGKVAAASLKLHVPDFVLGVDPEFPRQGCRGLIEVRP